MTSPALPDVKARRDLGSALRRQFHTLRLLSGSQEGWRSWFFEICILIVVILALSAVLQPRVMLMSASPHPFWLPVVAAALVHGTFPGLVAAALAGICSWLFGPALATTEDDFYDLMFRVFKEPVLWLFAAIVLGTFRDRIEDERHRLARERDEARDDLSLAVNHATALRGRIEDLERAIVLAESDQLAPRALVDSMPPDAEPSGRPSAAHSHEDILPEAELGVITRAPRQRSEEEAEHSLTLLPPYAPRALLAGSADFSFTWACLWEASPSGWERVGCEGSGDIPDPGRLLRHVDRQSRIYDSRSAEDFEILPSGALLAVPVPDGAGRAFQVLIVGGGSFGKAAKLEQALHTVLPLADRLGHPLLGGGAR
jgi:hypothetical protein